MDSVCSTALTGYLELFGEIRWPCVIASKVFGASKCLLCQGLAIFNNDFQAVEIEIIPMDGIFVIRGWWNMYIYE